MSSIFCVFFFYFALDIIMNMERFKSSDKDRMIENEDGTHTNPDKRICFARMTLVRLIGFPFRFIFLRMHSHIYICVYACF